MNIKFFQSPTPAATPSLSPFCAKLDMMLQLSGLNFTREVVMDPSKGPKQKIPFIEDDKGPLGDTLFIEAYLKSAYNVDLMRELSPEDAALGRMIMGTVEEQLYFIIVYSRWQIEANWPIMEETFFGHMSPEKRAKIAPQALEMMRDALKGQGIGRHSEEEVFALGARIIDDLATLLGDNAYFFGDNPTSVDASVYGALINLVGNPVPTPLAAHIKTHNNLSAYLDRITAQYFANAARASAKAA